MMGKKVCVSSRPDIMNLWDYEANARDNIFAEKLSVSSREVANWICEFGHHYKATVFSKYQKYGCPYCTNRLVLAGYNDFASRHPDLLKEWDFEKNTVNPDEITETNGKKYWWICKQGHSWDSRTADRINGHGCPYCSGRNVEEAVSDLKTLFPQIALEWNYNKNGKLKPTNVKAGSKKTVWWVCTKGHEWPATIKNRTLNKSDCPYCSGTKVAVGETDLATKYPILSKEWNYEKNGRTLPQHTACFSNVKVWWRGRCGHEWQDTPGHRVMGRNCPICNKQNRTSFPEQAIFYYVHKNYCDAVNSYTEIFPGTMELDVYIPSIAIGIEYDGKAWHNTEKSRARENRKYEICKENNIMLIRVKEQANAVENEACDITIVARTELQQTLVELSKYVQIDDFDVDADRQAILESYLERKRKDSLAELYPKVAQEWNYDKNGSLRPDMFFSSSGEKVWWICNKGHEYDMQIRERTAGLCGCPYCSNHRLLQGYNDLRTVAPCIADEWDANMNGDLSPEIVKATSTYKAYWTCLKGHTWQAKVGDRVRRMSGCPVCYRNRRN